MKFSINQSVLNKTLSLAARVLPRRAVNPMLNNFFLDVSKNSLLVRSLDADQSFEAVVEAKAKEPFAVCVDGSRLAQIVSRAEDAELDFELKENNLVLKRKKGNVQFRTSEAEKFPKHPDISKASDFVVFRTTDLRRAFQGALLGTEEDKIILDRFTNVAEMKIEKRQFRVLATDKKILSFITGSCIAKADLMLQIPVSAMRLIIPSLAQMEKAYPETQIGQDQNHLFIRFSDKLHYSFRKLEAKFPDFSSVFTVLKFDKSLTVDAFDLVRGIETAAILSDERTQSIKFGFSDDSILLSTCSADAGELEETVAAKGKIEPFTAIYGFDYVLPVLRRLDGEISLNFAEMTDAKTGEIHRTLKISSDSNGVQENYYIQSKRF